MWLWTHTKKQHSMLIHLMAQSIFSILIQFSQGNSIYIEFFLEFFQQHTMVLYRKIQTMCMIHFKFQVKKSNYKNTKPNLSQKILQYNTYCNYKILILDFEQFCT
eukprot:EC095005.1.p1 GENE.EC095005.1~~EC095005.1.p1  ORF type:complete len:105 (+),score=7.14 EC095005.1:119-433(+)